MLQLIRDVRDRGLPAILTGHNMPEVFDIADRIHIQRLGWRAAVITPKSRSMPKAVAIMMGAAPSPEQRAATNARGCARAPGQ